MPARTPPTPHRDTYWARTRRPVYSLVIVAPLLVAFHTLGPWYGGTLLAPRLVGRFLHFFGATQPFLPPLLILGVLLIAQLARKCPWRVEPAVAAGMVGESVLWTVPLVGLAELTGRIAAQAPAAGLDAYLQPAYVAIGAGIYEEFVFRLVFISLAVLLFADLLGLKPEPVALAAILAGAGLFAFCHFLWQPFQWNRFIFLTVAGVLWGGLYLFRGFAVAVCCHIVWDLYAFAMQG